MADPKTSADESHLPRLDLPKRWELLRRRAEEVGVNPVDFVQRVDVAAQRVDTLLQLVRTGAGGMFEIIRGLSGSGKTTFLNTLPKFFVGVQVSIFPSNQKLTELPKFLEAHFRSKSSSERVVVIEGRDVPS